jgi:hypothetical protein
MGCAVSAEGASTRQALSAAPRVASVQKEGSTLLSPAIHLKPLGLNLEPSGCPGREYSRSMDASNYDARGSPRSPACRQRKSLFRLPSPHHTGRGHLDALEFAVYAGGAIEDGEDVAGRVQSPPQRVPTPWIWASIGTIVFGCLALLLATTTALLVTINEPLVIKSRSSHLSTSSLVPSAASSSLHYAILSSMILSSLSLGCVLTLLGLLPLLRLAHAHPTPPAAPLSWSLPNHEIHPSLTEEKTVFGAQEAATARANSALRVLSSQLPTTPSVQLTADAILIDGTPRLLRGSSFQWYRMDPAVWRDRLLRIKGMGYNAVDMYVSWEHHEPREGHFDFTTFNLRACLKLVASLDLLAYIRPGPYITNEQEGGGIPGWMIANSTKTLFNVSNHPHLRTEDPIYLQYVSRYYTAVADVVRPFQRSRGGPVILWAVENEYDWFGDFVPAEQMATYEGEPERPKNFRLNSRAYFQALHDMSRAAGIDVPITTCPGIGWIRETGDVPDIIPLANMYRDAPGKFTLAYTSWSLKRDMSNPQHHNGVYANFPSGTSETHRFPDVLRSMVLSGMDAIFQFNQVAFHQSGRFNTMDMDSTDIFTNKQRFNFLLKNSNIM